LRELGDEGIIAVVGDSTNALVPGHSRSEGDLEESLTHEFAKFQGRIAVTCFSSNVARMATIQRAAAANGRQTALVGRSLWRAEEAARDAGYLAGIPPFLTENDIGLIPEQHLVLICTGSQGEPRSALSRISEGDHPYVKLSRGDAVIFSARAIPGNQKAIVSLQSRLAKAGIQIVTPDEAFVHVSGHPAQEELALLYQWLRPKALIPTHGEYPHLVEHARIARDCQIARTLLPENGQVIRISKDTIEVVDHVEAGLLAVDGTRIVDLDAASLRTRQKLSFDGAILCSLVLDRKGRILLDPAISAPGVLSPDTEDKALKTAVQQVKTAMGTMPLQALKSNDQLHEAIRMTLRRHFNTTFGKKPWIDIHIARVE
jgi:ribonuclease J